MSQTDERIAQYRKMAMDPNNELVIFAWDRS